MFENVLELSKFDINPFNNQRINIIKFVLLPHQQHQPNGSSFHLNIFTEYYLVEIAFQY